MSRSTEATLATGSPAGNRPPTPLVTMVSPTLMSALAAR
ncbi:Uncharacterised protein [Bordetella pertussis]|nr:Uncharacterised protein [Bordetella pertussis]